MKKLLLIISLLALTGCNNPISSAIDKEGDKTRVELQQEVSAATQQIIDANDEQVNALIDAIICIVNGQPIIRVNPK